MISRAILAVARRIRAGEDEAHYGVHRDDAHDASWVIVVPADPDGQPRYEGQASKMGYPMSLALRVRERFLATGEWPAAVGYNA